jgi:hypothetical protein
MTDLRVIDGKPKARATEVLIGFLMEQRYLIDYQIETLQKSQAKRQKKASALKLVTRDQLP